MLRPKQTKFRKQRTGRLRGNSAKNLELNQGTYGLKSLESGRITARQIEATRVTITRKIKRKGKLWIRLFPSVPITSKPVEVRMGKGKGSVDYFAAPIRAGSILYEISGVPTEVAIQALKAGAKKLPVNTRIISKSS
jgi:large subunit ribosomal protein L16